MELQFDISGPPDPLPLAAAGAPVSDPVLAAMLADYASARAESGEPALGDHWSGFRPDFDRLIRTAGIWPRFRQLGVSYLFDDSLHYATGHVDPALRPALCDLEELRPWGFLTREIKARIAQTMRAIGGQIPLNSLVDLAEAEIGTPHSIRFDGLQVALDWHDISQIYFALRLGEFAGELGTGERLVFLEIGGGLGGTAAKLRKLVPGAQCIIVDLPEVGAVQRYYLSKAEPEARILGMRAFGEDPDAAIRDADYLLLPPQAIGRIPDGSVDMAANIRSFMEMPSAIVATYIREIERLLRDRGGFYCANALSKDTSGEEIRLADYPFDTRWSLPARPSPIPWQDHIVALKLFRHGTGVDLARQLENLAAGQG